MSEEDRETSLNINESEHDDDEWKEENGEVPFPIMQKSVIKFSSASTLIHGFINSEKG